VYYWDGSAPEGRRVHDISQSGAYICTPGTLVPPGTIIRLILQRGPRAERGDGATAPTLRFVYRASDQARIRRVAVEFVFRNRQEEESLRTFLGAIRVSPGGSVPGNGTSRGKGQALVEFALLVPLVFLLAVNAVNFGGYLFAWITVANAARSGADYMSMSSASVGAPAAATLAQITTLVTNDVSSLMNGPALRLPYAPITRRRRMAARPSSTPRRRLYSGHGGRDIHV